MTDLFEKSIQILELPKVLERLAGQAVTQEGIHFFHVSAKKVFCLIWVIQCPCEVIIN